MKLYQDLSTDTGWEISENHFQADSLVSSGSNFMIGNGYLGYRGTFESWGKEQYAACIVTDTWDLAEGSSMSELCNVPNALFTALSFNGAHCAPESGKLHEYIHSLDLRHGINQRNFRWEGPKGQRLEFESRKFASLNNPHLLVTELRVRALTPGVLEVRTGIDGEVWSIGGAHFASYGPRQEGSLQLMDLRTQEKGTQIAVVESSRIDGPDPIAEEVKLEERQVVKQLQYQLGEGDEVRMFKVVSITHSNEVARPLERAVEEVEGALEAGYDALHDAHCLRWDDFWELSDIRIEGNLEAQTLVRFNLYQAFIATPTHANLPVGARGLSCQVYQGAAFWDQETYNLPMFALTHQDVAKRLVSYRYDTLDGARRKASGLGYYGAFYAWTSGKTGDELFPDFFFTDVLTGRKIRNHFNCWQIHISPDVVYGIWLYFQATGDWDFMVRQGAEVLFEVAQFLVSRVHFKKDKNRYEIIRVLGPDEYHENVDNNAYTNYLSRFALQKACRVFDRMQEEDGAALRQLLNHLELDAAIRATWMEIAELLYLPKPDPKTLLIEQFDGYFQLEDIRPEALRKRLIHPEEYWGWPNGIAVHTQVLKQADVIQLLAMLDAFPRDVLTANYEYYEPRTEHGSSLSPSVHALVASKAGHPDEAYRYFMESATIDLYNASKKVMSGGSFLGGIHTAAAGGVWLIVVKGFAGFELTDEGARFTPALPQEWKALNFKLCIRGCLLHVRLEGNSIEIQSPSSNPHALQIRFPDGSQRLDPGSVLRSS